VDSIAKFTVTGPSPGSAVGNLDIALEWNGDGNDLLNIGVFRRWFKARVEDECGRVKKGGLDDPYAIFRRFDASKDRWWESWDSESCQWQLSRGWGHYSKYSMVRNIHINR